MFVVRAAAKAFSGEALGRALLLQLGNMVGLYTAMALLNTRSRRRGSGAAQQVRRGGGHACRRHVGATTTAAAAHAAHVWWQLARLGRAPPACMRPPHPAANAGTPSPVSPPQEELLLSALIAAVISVLLLSLRPGNASDYVYAALFLTCTSSVLKLRWLVGTLALAVPVLLAAATNLRLRWPDGAAHGAAACLADLGAQGDLAGTACPADAAVAAAVALGPLEFVAVGPLPLEALVHIVVAWAVGALMAYVSGEAAGQLGAWNGAVSCMHGRMRCCSEECWCACWCRHCVRRRRCCRPRLTACTPARACPQTPTAASRL